MSKYNYNLKKNLFNIALVSYLLGLLLLVDYLFGLIPKIGGISCEFYLIIVIFGLILIPNKFYKLIYLIIIPVFKMFVYPAYAVNNLDLFLEYYLTIYIYFILICFDNFLIVKYNKKRYLLFDNNNRLYWFNINLDTSNYLKNKQINFVFSFICINILILLLRYFIYVYAGYLWYTQHNWIASFIYETFGYITTFVVITLLVTLCTYPILKLKVILLKRYK